MKELKIDRTIREIIPALTSQEYSDLEDSIVAEGCLYPIVIWKDKNIILDGHNRYDICQKHKMEFQILEKEFSSKKEALIWMIKTQLGRRNLTDAQKVEMAIKQKELEGKGPFQLLKRESREEIAEEINVSTGNIHKVKTVLDEGKKKIKKKMLEGEISINKAYEETTGKMANPKKEPKPEDKSETRKPPAPLPEILEDEEPCSKCHGTGKQKKVKKVEQKTGGIQKDGSWLCGMCGRVVHMQVELLKVCPGCSTSIDPSDLKPPAHQSEV